MAKRQKIGVLQAILSADSKQFTKSIAGAQKSLSSVGGKLKRVGAGMQSMGRGLAASVTLPLIGIGAVIARTAGKFEASMNFVQSLTRATGKDFDALKQKAMDLGRDTQFSASQAADAMVLLAQAGLKQNEILEAAPEMLNLAAAAGIELADATDRALTVMKGYGKEIKDLPHINDVLAKTATSLNTTIVDLSDAMFKVQPIARAAGIEFEETSAILGLMQEGGLKSTEAGTALKAILGGILNPASKLSPKLDKIVKSFKNADGTMKPFTEVMKSLGPIANDAGAMMKLFSKRGGPGMAILLNQGIPKLKGLTKTLKEVDGEAKRVAEDRMRGFSGAIKKLVSAFENLQLKIAQSGFLDFMTKMVERLSDFLRYVASASPRVIKFGVLIAAAAAAAGPMLWILGGIVGILGSVVTAVVAAGAALFTFATGPIGIVVAAIGALALAWYKYGDDIKKRFPKTIEMFQKGFTLLKSIFVTVSKLFAKVFITILEVLGIKLGAKMKEAGSGFELFKMVALGALNYLADGIETWSTTISVYIDRFSFAWENGGKQIVEYLTKMMGQIKEQLVGRLGRVAEEAGKKISTVTNFFKGMWDKVTKHSYVPEMMDEIQNEFGRLQKDMLDPARLAAKGVKGIFADLKKSLGKTLRSLAGSFLSAGLGSFGGKSKSGLFGGLQNMMGFAQGGSFTVGGAGGTDSQLVAFRATPGEMVDVSKKNDGGPTGSTTVVQHNSFGVGVRDSVRAEVMSTLPMMRDATMGAIEDGARRGTGLSRALKGR